MAGHPMSDAERLAAVADRVVPGSRLHAARRLTGGVSADVRALEIDAPDGRRHTVVLRHYVVAGGKLRHDEVAVMEHGLLEVLHRAGLPVPEPLLLDTSGRLMPEPFLVMAFVEGEVALADSDVDAALVTMADALVQLHDLPTDMLPQMPRRSDPLPEVFDYLPEAAQWSALRAYLAACTDSAYGGRPALLHGDFWPGNLLWQDGRLVAILDWEDAAIGDPLSDLAGSRVELLWKYGADAMEAFTWHYARGGPVDGRRLALWDVFAGAAASRFMGYWGLDPDREADMRRNTHGFVQAAAARLLSG